MFGCGKRILNSENFNCFNLNSIIFKILCLDITSSSLFNNHRITTKSQNYLRLNLFGDNNASGSPHLSRLDENAVVDVTPDDYRNIGLAIDLLCRNELPLLLYLTLDSDNGKKPLLQKNSDFIPL